MTSTNYTKLDDFQTEIIEVTNIMKTNLQKVIDIDANINDLEDKSENLKNSSHRFGIQNFVL